MALDGCVLCPQPLAETRGACLEMCRMRKPFPFQWHLNQQIFKGHTPHWESDALALGKGAHGGERRSQGRAIRDGDGVAMTMGTSFLTHARLSVEGRRACTSMFPDTVCDILKKNI